MKKFNVFFKTYTGKREKRWKAYYRAMSQVYKKVDINIAQGKLAWSQRGDCLKQIVEEENKFLR